MTRKGPSVAWMLCGILLLVVPGGPFAASPPALTHYQGVLRSAADEPLTGAYDMDFRFFDLETGGNEILVDRHLAANAQAVTVEGGLFAVALGSGQVIDGSGPGTYASMADLFRDHSGVWLEVTIGAETLAPRTRVLATGYALNATTAGTAATATSAATATTANQLNGQPSSFYLDTSSNYQTKTGNIRFTAANPSLAVVDAIAAPGSLGALVASSSGAYCKVAFAGQGTECYGNTFGGFFRDLDEGSAWAYAGYAGYGIYASGSIGVRGNGDGASAFGGYFVAPGTGGIGVYGDGATYGGHFTSSASSVSGMAGRFEQLAIPGTYVNVAWSGYGIWSRSYHGIHNWDENDGTYARIGASPYKIQGTGAVSFVQNHPNEPDQVVIYHAPESSEVNVYTRGSAKLTGGVARIPLDPTFAWTANPDLGLTAHLTPRGEPVALAVESVTSRELSVRGPHGSDVEFDYWVTGLRIGFEEMPPVSGKEFESPLPLKASGAQVYAAKPGLRAFNALERYRGMAREVGRDIDPDMKASAHLRQRIGFGKPMSATADPVPQHLQGLQPGSANEVRAAAAAGEPVAPAPRPDSPPSGGPEGAPGDNPGSVAYVRHPLSDFFPTRSAIEAGDVVVNDAEERGSVKRADRLEDRTVIGIAISPAADGRVEVAMASVAEVRVDAGYGAILAGDLLVSSATPGAAMLATTPEPGTILGKALEPLDSGIGTIRVLVMLR